jgi:hypothetical protein
MSWIRKKQGGGAEDGRRVRKEAGVPLPQLRVWAPYSLVVAGAAGERGWH